jgi:hypothetical protein
MNKSELNRLEGQVLQELAKREQLGGYDVNASIIVRLVMWIALIIQHINKKPKLKKPKKK